MVLKKAGFFFWPISNAHLEWQHNAPLAAPYSPQIFPEEIVQGAIIESYWLMLLSGCCCSAFMPSVLCMPCVCFLYAFCACLGHHGELLVPCLVVQTSRQPRDEEQTSLGADKTGDQFVDKTLE